MRRCRVGVQDPHGVDAADAGQVDVHQDHRGLVDAGEFDAEIAVGRGEQAQVGAARDQLFDQGHVGGIVFDIEQGTLRRADRQRRLRRRHRVVFGRAQPGCVGQVQFDPEHGARADGAFNADRPAHQFDQLPGHHQADPGAFFGAGPAAEPIEGLEQLGQLLWCQAGPGIAHADANQIGAAHLAFHGDAAARPVVLDGIEQQVDQHLLDPGPVGAHKARCLEARKDHRDAALLRLRLDQGAAVEHHLGQRHRLVRHRYLARLDQREVEDFVDQFQQVPAGLQDLVNAFLLANRWCRRAGFHQLGEPQDGVQRGAQLMAHAGQEIRFREVGLLCRGQGLVAFNLEAFAHGHIAQHAGEVTLASQPHFGGRDFQREGAAILAPADGRTPLAGGARLVARAVVFERTVALVAAELGHQQAERLRRELFRGIAEHARDRRVDGLDDAAGRAQGDDAVGHSVEDGLDQRGVVAHHRLQLMFPRHVAEHQHRADHQCIAVANRRATVGDGAFAAVARDQQRVVGHRLTAAVRQRVDDRVDDGLTALLVDDVNNIVDRPADRLRLGPAGEALGQGIQAHHQPRGIGGDHRIADRVERDHEVFPAFLQGEVGLL